ELCKLCVAVGQSLLQLTVRGLPLRDRVLPLRQIFVPRAQSRQLSVERCDALRLLRKPLLELGARSDEPLVRLRQTLRLHRRHRELLADRLAIGDGIRLRLRLADPDDRSRTPEPGAR